MENLNRFVDENYTVSLIDYHGITLALTASNDEVNKFVHEQYTCEGGSWAEQETGTTAAGVVMEIRRPIHIHATQHYCKFFHSYSAYGAPIFDPKGIIGCICLVTQFTEPQLLSGHDGNNRQGDENDLRIGRRL
jgi:transcriptional regulator of acetoin/glycerol metabolism